MGEHGLLWKAMVWLIERRRRGPHQRMAFSSGFALEPELTRQAAIV
jgi:hypothetical protein